MTAGMSPDAGPRPGAEQAAPRPKVERHPIRDAKEIVGGITRAARGVMEERRLGKMSPADREKALREKEKSQEAPLNARVDVVVVGGANRETLSSEAREHIRQAQQELIRAQGVDVSKLKPEERQKRLDELRSKSRVVVLNGGSDVVLVQGDQRGYTVMPDGKLSLHTYQEQEMLNGKPVTVKNEQTGQDEPKMVERSSEANVAKVSFESAQATTAYGTSREVPRVRVLDAAADGKAQSNPRDISQTTERGVVTQENVFAGVADHLVHMDYHRLPGMRDATGRDMFVLNLGAETPEVRARALRTAADVMDGGIRVTGAEVVIAGAGADMLKVAGRRGGMLEVANIIEPWQVKGKEVPVAPGTPAERQTVDLALSADDKRRFDQLPREQQLALLGRQANALPAGVDRGLLDFKVTVQGTGELPEGAVELTQQTRNQLESQAATALHRAQEILNGTMRPEDLDAVNDRSELALIIGRGNTGYDNPATAMTSANQFVETIRQSVESQFAQQGNTRSRQEIARSLINAQFPEAGRSAEATAAVERLAVSIGNRTPDEVVRDIKDAARPEGQTPETFKAGLVDQLRGTEGYRNLDDAQLSSVVDALRGEGGAYTGAELYNVVVDAIRTQDVSSRREALQELLTQAEGRGENVESAQRLLDTVAPRATTIEDLGTLLGDYTLDGTVSQHRAELISVLDKIVPGDISGATQEQIDNARRTIDTLAPAEVSAEQLNGQVVTDFMRFREAHQGDSDQVRMQLAAEVGRIVATLPLAQREAANATLLGLIPPAPAQTPNYVAVVPQGVTPLTGGAVPTPTPAGE